MPATSNAGGLSRTRRRLRARPLFGTAPMTDTPMPGPSGPVQTEEANPLTGDSNALPGGATTPVPQQSALYGAYARDVFGGRRNRAAAPDPNALD